MEQYHTDKYYVTYIHQQYVYQNIILYSEEHILQEWRVANIFISIYKKRMLIKFAVCYVANKQLCEPIYMYM
jgi:hypothetical protein